MLQQHYRQFQNPIQLPRLDFRHPRWIVPALLSALMFSFLPSATLAQTIVPAGDGTGTIVTTPDGRTFTITGGQRSGDGTNLFQSFLQFGLSENQIATFLSNPEIQNILARVTGGEASVINGLLQVSGGQSNFFLMNPAGIVFGQAASLNVPASFIATTANGIGFGNQWFQASGPNNYTNLSGNPTGFALTMGQPGAIVNAGQLSVPQGDLALLGGTVISTGSLSAPQGHLLATSVPGQTIVRLIQPGQLLSFEIQPASFSDPLPQNWTLPILTLPQLLSGAGSSATQLGTNLDGTITLSGSGIRAATGDTSVKQAIARSATLAAAQNLNLVESNLQTAGDLRLYAANTVKVRDSQAQPFLAVAGRQFTLQGDQAVDIFALNNSQSGLYAGGDLLLRSNSPVGGDAHYWSNSNFRIETLDGRLGGLFSPYDPVIQASGDVSFSSYNGASLHILAGGSVNVSGAIQITGSDTTFGLPNTTITLSDGSTLTLQGQIEPTLDIRAGTTGFGTPGTTPSTPTGFTPGVPGTGGSPTGSSITIGSINFGVSIGNKLQVLLSNQYQPNTALAAGNITVNGTTFVQNDGGLGSTVTIDSRAGITLGNNIVGGPSTGTGATINLLAQGDIKTNNLFAGAGTGNGGNVTLKTPGSISVQAIDTGTGNLGAGGPGNGGSITLSAGNNITTGGRLSSGSSVSGTGGNITLTSSKGSINTSAGLVASGRFSTTSSNSGNGGNIAFTAQGDITTAEIASGIATINPSTNRGGNISLSSRGGNIKTSSLLSLSTGNQGGGNVFLSSPGNITSSFILTQSVAGSGGTINVTAGGNFQAIESLSNAISSDSLIQNAYTFLRNPSALGALFEFETSTSLSTSGTSGGAVNIQANQINTGNISTSSFASGNGGNLSLIATRQIKAGTIDSSALFANGGNVLLDPIEDIEVTWIKANGGLASEFRPGGRGGEVTVTTDRFFRVTGSFRDIFGVTASISTAGGTGGGSITITHGGRTLLPFIVGNASLNGTAAAITSGSTTIFPSESFYYTIQRGNIGIISGNPTVFREPDQKPIFKAESTLDLKGECLVDSGFSGAEAARTRDFEQATGVSARGSQGLGEACQILANAAQSTGVKPALIYVSFVPARFSDKGKLPAGRPDGDLLWQFNPNSDLWAQQIPQKSAKQESDELELMIVTATGGVKRQRVLGVTYGQVMQTVRQFRTTVTDPASSDYLDSAQRLYRWFILPLEAELKKQQVGNLVFLMDTGLRALPIAALHDGKKFLVEKYSVGMMPSLSLTDTRVVDIRKTTLLAMGASQFRDQVPLPAVPTELSLIGNLWAGKTFLNETFTLNNLQQQRQQQPFGIIHLATHGEFKPGGWDKSYIQLWDTQLRLDQVRNLGWNNPPVQLLVLSACRTALGDEQAELGFAGMAVKTGVKSALASLWYVSDEGTLGLMREFYQGLQSAPIKAEALRQAQLALIQGKVKLQQGKLQGTTGAIELPAALAELQNTNLSHPYYWAAFTLVGNPW